MKEIKAYKAFNKDMTCKNFPYKVGEEYNIDGDVRCCIIGFHACEQPFDVLRYYPPLTSRFATVTLSGKIDASFGDSKLCASHIKIKKEITLRELIIICAKTLNDFTRNYITVVYPSLTELKDAIYARKVIFDSSRLSNPDSYFASKASFKGIRAEIGIKCNGLKLNIDSNDNDVGLINKNICLYLTESHNNIYSIGRNCSIYSSGYGGFIGSIGDRAYINVSGNNTSIYSSGTQDTIVSTGHFSEIRSEGKKAKIVCMGQDSKVRAKIGSWITLTSSTLSYPHDEYIRTEQVDGKHIKEDTWYMLKKGEFVEVKE